MNRINLIYLSPWPIGGSTSFTAHLYHSLKENGVDVRVLKLGNKTESGQRKMGDLNVLYRNMSLNDMLKEVDKYPSLLTAPAHSKNFKDPLSIKKLIEAGMRVVVHDPHEFDHYDHLEWVENPITIRKPAMSYFDKATFIPHPYVRKYDDTEPDKRPMAGVSTALIIRMKNPHIILEANRITKLKKHKIHLVGKENRLYTHRSLKPKYPEFEGSKGFPRTLHASAELCRKAFFNVDLTSFGTDGGDSSYSILEGMDAGSIMIVHKDWLGYKGRMKDMINCISVDNPEELANLVLKRESMKPVLKGMRQEGYKFLKRHNPKKIAKLYKEEFL